MFSNKTAETELPFGCQHQMDTSLAGGALPTCTFLQTLQDIAVVQELNMAHQIAPQCSVSSTECEIAFVA